MDTATQDIYLQKVQEQIEDEDKIVTLTALAKNLEISVQDSAQILNQYWKDNQTVRPDSLSATFILSGTLKNGNTKTVCLVKDVDLKCKKEEFEEVTSEILYCVQKGKDVDFNVIAIADWPSLTNSQEKPMPLYGTIISKNCTIRNIKHKILPPPPPSTLKGKSACFAPKTQTKVAESSSEGSSSINNTKKVSEAKSGTISGLFSKAAETKKESQKKVSPETKPISKNKPGKGSLSTFFSKSSSTTSNGSTKNEDHHGKDNGFTKSQGENTGEDISNSPLNDGNFGSDIEMEEIEKKVLEEKPHDNVNKSNKKLNKKEKSKSVKRTRDKSDDKNSKRRKRIIERADSDSDDMFGNDENDEDCIEKSDEEIEKNPSPITVKQLPPKNKKRVAVDRSYVDEEGFMVTKREYVYESASEEEVEVIQPEKKKSPQKPIEKKKSTSSGTDSSPQPVKNGKKAKKNAVQGQQTLMNFFKKK